MKNTLYSIINQSFLKDFIDKGMTIFEYDCGDLFYIQPLSYKKKETNIKVNEDDICKLVKEICNLYNKKFDGSEQCIRINDENVKLVLLQIPDTVPSPLYFFLDIKMLRKEHKLADIEANEENDKMSLGARVREIRKKKGISIVQLQKKTGLSKSTISDLENNKSSPTIETLQKIAKALEVDIRMFFINDNKNNELDDLLINFPEAVSLLKQANKKLDFHAKKQLVAIIEAFLETFKKAY